MTFEATPPTHTDSGASSDKESSEFPDWLREVAQLAGRTPRSASPDLVGAVLCAGRFEVQGVLGRGGMGQVYEALDRTTHSAVALKTLQRITPNGIYRLKREFRALSGVRHENLVRMHQLFEDAGCWFFTMDLVRGVPLDAYLRRNASEPVVRHVFGQLVAGVCAIHAAGKVHRDLKPSNVLVSEQHRLTILDFGLVSESATQPLAEGDTLGAAVVGTPAYMAPEQRIGQHTAASDLYAVGLMLYQVLAFARPFEKSGGESFTWHNQDGPRPSSLKAGVPPDLDGLCAELLRLEPALRPTAVQAQRVLAVLDPGVRPSVERGLQSTLLGREPEFEQLGLALKSVSRGATQVVLVEGPSGIGKSALASRFVSQARLSGRALVFEGGCYENESVPYKGIEAIVDEIAHFLRTADDRETFIPPGISALARVFPTLGRVEFVARLAELYPVVTDEHSQREQAFLCLRQLLTRLGAHKPVIVCLDDAQWADEDSAALLGYALSPPIGPRLLFVATCRTDIACGGFVPLFERACKLKGVNLSRLELPPLPATAAHELANSLLSDPVRSALVLEEAQGHPFLIHEYCRFFSDLHQEPAQVSLSGVILERMAALGDSARALVELVAVAATPLRRDTIWHVLGVPDELWYEATVSRLCVERLLRACSGNERDSLVCYHDRVRAAVMNSLDEVQLQTVHDRLAQAMLVTQATDFESLAFHLAGAGQLPAAASLAERAGDSAMVNLAFHRAASWYREALRWGLVPLNSGTLRVKLAQALTQSGYGAAAAEIYLEVAVSEVDSRRAHELRTQAAEQYLVTGHYVEGTSLVAELLAECKLAVPASRFGLYLRYALERVLLKWKVLTPKRGALTRVSDALTRQRLVVCRAAACTFGVSDVVQGAAYATQYLRLALTAGDASHVLHGLGTEIAAVASAGPKARARVWQLMQSAEPWRKSASAPSAVAYFDATCGAARVLMGDFSAGAEQTEQAEIELRNHCTGVTWELNIARTFMAIAWLVMGEVRLLSERVPRWLEDARERSDLYASTHLRLTLPLALLAADDVEAAATAVSDAEKAWNAQRFDQAVLNICDARTSIELYRGADADTLRLLCSQYRQFFKTALAYAHGNRVFSHYFAGCCELGLMDLGQADSGTLGRVARHARVLCRDRAAYARGYGALLGAAVAWRRGDVPRSLAGLEAASLELQAASVNLAAAAARRRLGLLLASPKGDVHVEAACLALRARGVVRPDRFADALVPGFGLTVTSDYSSPSASASC